MKNFFGIAMYYICRVILHPVILYPLLIVLYPLSLVSGVLVAVCIHAVILALRMVTCGVYFLWKYIKATVGVAGASLLVTVCILIKKHVDSVSEILETSEMISSKKKWEQKCEQKMLNMFMEKMREKHPDMGLLKPSDVAKDSGM